MQKIILIAAVLLSAIQSTAQISVDVGIESSELAPTVKVAYEKTMAEWFNAELAVRSKISGASQIVPSLSGGGIMPTKRGSFKVLAGGFYHVWLPVNKDIPHDSFRFGGSIRWEVNQGTFGAEWNGVFASLTVGFIFKRNDR